MKWYTLEERMALTTLMKHKNYSYVPELKTVVKDIELSDFQTRALAFSLVNRKTICSLDTGLGKSLIAAGFINVIAQSEFGKTVMIVPSFTVNQMLSKLNKHLFNLKVVATDNQAANVEAVVMLDEYAWDVLVVSYEAFSNYRLQQYLLALREYISTLIVDESQLLANLEGETSLLMQAMCESMDYVLFLTATPIRVNVEQFINQLCCLNPNIFGKYRKAASIYFTERDDVGKPVGVKNLMILLEMIKLNYISITRKSLNLKGNYRTKALLVEPTEYDLKVSRSNLFEGIKGRKDSDAVRVLVNQLNQYRALGKKGIVYCNRNANKKMLSEVFRENNLRHAILDGSVSNTRKKKDIEMERFNNDELDVVITNLSVGLDLDCDFIIFYEMTFDYKQVLGRGERGLKVKDLDIVFIIVNGTVEVSFFYDNVVSHLRVLAQTCDKDIEEFEEMLERMAPKIRFPDIEEDNDVGAF